MDFKTIKEKALKLKDKASKKTLKAINYGAEKLANSKFTIETKEGIDKLIKKSEDTKFKNKKTGKEVTYKHKSIIIFAEEGSDFFKESLYALPVLATKAFSQNISIKLAKSKIKGIKLSDYKVKPSTLPCLVVFENKIVIKTIEGSENILKLVKSLNLNINKLLEDNKK